MLLKKQFNIKNSCFTMYTRILLEIKFDLLLVSVFCKAGHTQPLLRQYDKAKHCRLKHLSLKGQCHENFVLTETLGF